MPRVYYTVGVEIEMCLKQILYEKRDEMIEVTDKLRDRIGKCYETSEGIITAMRAEVAREKDNKQKGISVIEDV